jgi:hypothetical protein
MKPVVRLRRTVTRALAVGAAVCLGAALVASPVLAAQQSQAAGGQTAVSQAEANGGGLIDRGWATTPSCTASSKLYSRTA